MSTSVRASSRTPLPPGTLPVAGALLVAGVATFAFFRIGTNAVGGKEEFKPISSLWFATFALAPGFFLPLEQELGRAIGQRRALGQGGQPVVAKVVRLGVMLGGLVALAILALSPLITANYFDGDWLMLAALVTAFVGYAPAHLARGICAGTGRCWRRSASPPRARTGSPSPPPPCSGSPMSSVKGRCKRRPDPRPRGAK